MNEIPIERMDEDLLGTVSEVEWLRSAPRPLNLSFSWETIVAAIVVGATILVLDFLSFRATELSHARQSTVSGQEQRMQQQQQQKRQKGKKRQHARSPSNGNRHGRTGASALSTASASPSGDGNGGVDGGGNGGTFMAARPVSRSTGGTNDSRVYLKRSLILAVWITGALYFHRMGLTTLARSSATIASLVACLPYLLRSSKYRRDSALGCVLEASDKRRSVTDMLVWTSLVYVLPSVYGLYVHQYGIAALQLMTTIGSTLFHLTRETKFFNLDNVFATSLLLTTVWALFLAATRGVWWYVSIVGLGGPFAIFCIVRCGMPGLVCRHPSGHGLCRMSNPEYDFFHMLWHLSSGLGTLISIHYFEVNFPAEEAGGGWFYYFPDIPVVPTVCLTISALINLYGNRVGLMPLE